MINTILNTLIGALGMGIMILLGFLIATIVLVIKNVSKDFKGE